ncbi:MAG: ABC transporter permease subunit [Anaerolineae bacterium]
MNPSRESVRPILKRLSAGKNAEAAILLARRIERNPSDEVAWHLLSSALSDPKQQIQCLERVLEINPQNQAAASRLAELSGAVEPVEATDEESEEEEEDDASTADRPRPPPGIGGGPGIQPHHFNPNRSWLTSPAGVGRGASAAAAAVPFPARGAVPIARRSRRQRLRIRSRLWWQRARMDWRAFSESPLAILGVVLILLFALMAIAHPILMRTVWPSGIYDPVTGYDTTIFDHPSLPGRGHLLGTDTLGRDVLSMLLAATTPTFVLGLTAALTTALIGTVLSVTAAYFRGKTDAVLTNLADVFLLFPAPVIMVIIGARFRELGPVPLGFIYGLVTGAGATVIVMRAHALQVMSKPYMQAAEIAGGSSWHIIVKHLLPAMLPLAALQMMIAVTGAVVADGFISFFGLTRTTSNWGTIIYNAFVYRGIGGTDRIWHLILPAAICFSLFALGFYLVSRGLHRVASPTIRSEENRI